MQGKKYTNISKAKQNRRYWLKSPRCPRPYMSCASRVSRDSARRRRLMSWGLAAHPCVQGRRHGFLSGGSNRRQGGQPTPKYPKNRKKHRILATSFSNLGGRTTRFSKVRGHDPPTPRRRRPCMRPTAAMGLSPATARCSSWLSQLAALCIYHLIFGKL